MITERDIAEKFTIIWKQNFPLLTPSFMKLFNEARVSKLNIKEALLVDEVRYDLVSELAFNLTQLIIEKKIKGVEFLQSENNTKPLIEKIYKSIRPYSKPSEDELILTNTEIADTLNLCSNTCEFLSEIGAKQIRFKPKLCGYGIIPSLEADIEVDNCLFEIKTVTRNFKSSDLKQLFIYLALKQVSKEKNWTNAGLYNPRKGTFCRFGIAELIDDITGGKTPNEAFENLLNSLTRDIELDSNF